jgi:adenosylhomocysteine nucleosidase
MIGVVAALPAEGRCLDAAAGRRVVVSGVGEAAAARACARLLGDGATALVSWGTAAGLTDALGPGRIVIAGTEAWVSRVVERVGPLAERGGIAYAGSVLATPADKRALAAATGAVVADMETDAVSRAARAAGVPWLAVRAVADTVDVFVPASVLRAIDADGRVRYGRLGAALLARPGDLAALPRVARGFNAALRALRLLASRAGAELCFAELAAVGS